MQCIFSHILQEIHVNVHARDAGMLPLHRKTHVGVGLWIGFTFPDRNSNARGKCHFCNFELLFRIFLHVLLYTVFFLNKHFVGSLFLVTFFLFCVIQYVATHMYSFQFVKTPTHIVSWRNVSTSALRVKKETLAAEMTNTVAPFDRKMMRVKLGSAT